MVPESMNEAITNVRRRDGDLAQALVRVHVADTRAAAVRAMADGTVSRPVPL
jgi:DNA-binding GntR family transcriptional regulator